ncbi:hypothetical protein GOODEAATRI_033222 [Goodea atripinnis]|uniref:Uncharacterized protein n=1 Tax=Goodea atripinnis TaxID=208336 RepID=A0ABV0NQ68_9TELE
MLYTIVHFDDIQGKCHDQRLSHESYSGNQHFYFTRFPFMKEKNTCSTILTHLATLCRNPSSIWHIARLKPLWNKHASTYSVQLCCSYSQDIDEYNPGFPKDVHGVLQSNTNEMKWQSGEYN